MLSRHDPEGLLAMPGMPPDEYEPEAADFAARLARGQTITEDVVVAVWEHWFGPGSGLVRHSGRAAVRSLAADLDRLRRRREEG